MDTQLYQSDFYAGAQFLVIYSEYNAFSIGDIVTMLAASSRPTSILPMYSLGGREITNSVGTAQAWSGCNWDNGGTWIEIIPTVRMTDEDLFAVKIAGTEAVFGERMNDRW